MSETLIVSSRLQSGEFQHGQHLFNRTTNPGNPTLHNFVNPGDQSAVLV
jgi:hypothetical protein